MIKDNKDKQKNIKPRKVVKKISERYLKNSGQYYLNRFPASANHFLTVMTRKIDRSCREHTDQDRTEWIDHVRNITIPYFEKIGFLNDDLYAQALYNSLKSRGLSTRIIRGRMIKKGIEQHKVQELITDEKDGLNDKESIVLFAKKKKIGRYKIIPYKSDAEKQKDLGKLARAGFSYGNAISIFE